jgi:hypothetical protein
MQDRFAATAEQDMVETLSFYRAPSAMGDAFNATVAETVEHLHEWPYTVHRRRDLTDKDVCFWHESNYLFVLAIREEVLNIIAVLHASRNIAHILRKRLKQASL